MRISDWSSDVCSSDLLDWRSRVDEAVPRGENGDFRVLPIGADRAEGLPTWAVVAIDGRTPARSASFRCRTSEDEEAVAMFIVHDAHHGASGKGSAIAVPEPTAEWIQSVAACAAAAARKVGRGLFSRAVHKS